MRVSPQCRLVCLADALCYDYVTPTVCGTQGAAALHWLEPVLVPLVLAVLLSYCLSPVVEFAERRAGLPHGYALCTPLLWTACAAP